MHAGSSGPVGGLSAFAGATANAMVIPMNAMAKAVLVTQLMHEWSHA
jgi:hypothetical protein